MRAFRSLRYRDYRLFWVGAILSNTGTWMAAVASSWYVFLLTRSAFWVGILSFANFIPMVLSPFGGMIADRWDRRSILLSTQAFMMADAVVLAVLAQTGLASAPVIVALTAGVGLGFAFNAPAWQAFIPSLVPREHLVNAIALNSAQFSLARVVGPAVAGVLLASTSVALVFWLNAVSFVTVIAALLLVRGRGRPAPTGESPIAAIRAGMAYAWSHPTLRAMLSTIAAVSLFAAPVLALLPVYASDVYGRGSGAYGALAAAMGLGSVAGALILGGRARTSPRTIGWGVAVAAASLGAFAVVPSFGAGLALLVVYGAAYLFTVASTNSSIHTAVDEAYRGRVASLFMLAFGGLFPVGSLLAGTVAERVGPGPTTLAGAALTAGWAVWMLRSERRRGAGDLGPALAEG
ncbi:MAG: MFS transporter [Actinobacteria bacterium]|nr:MFS transporter [Actinomycetota bacterium]